MKKINTIKKNLFVLFILTLSFKSFGQILPEWVDTIGGTNPTLFLNGWTDMKVDPSGNTYVATIKGDTSYHYGLELGKYNTNGTRLFTIDTLLSYAYNVSIDIDDSMNLYAAVLDGSPNRILVLKYNTLGNLIWPSTNASLSPYQFGGPIKAAVDQFNNVYVSGEGDSIPDQSNHDIITMKFNSSGVYEWSARYDHYFNDGAFVSVGLDSLQNLYVVGRSYDSVTNFDIALLKYNSSGNQQWVRRFTKGIRNVAPVSMAISPGGNCYITGTYESYISGGVDYLTFKFDTYGNLKWDSEIVAGVADDETKEIKIDLAENVYITGTQNESQTPNQNFYTMKYDSSGNILWSRIYNSSDGFYSSEGASSICLDHLNNVYVTGFSKDTVANIWELFTIKYDANGDTLWIAPYYYYFPTWYSGFKCSCDSSNNVYLSGNMQGYVTSGFSNILTLKYGFSVGINEVTQKNSFVLFPNPTTNYITIHYNLPSPNQTALSLFNLYGQKLKTILNEKQPAGDHEMKIDMKDFVQGVYLVKMNVGGKEEVKKVVKY